MKVVCISDTHDQHKKLKIPECDMLIHAGDFTCHYDPLVWRYMDFNKWLGKLHIKHKVVIAGNHDTLFSMERKYAEGLMTNCIYLQDNLMEIEGFKVYGTPFGLPFAGWVFNLDEHELIDKYAKIPDDIDILITHKPPYGILDKSDNKCGQKHCGSLALKERVFEIKPKLHIFGDIHENPGIEKINGITFINASVVGLGNEWLNRKIIEVEI